MANRGNEEDEVEVEDVIFVAVGKDVKEGKSVLLWALKNSGGKKICILHVHEPAQRIPFMGTKAPAKSLTERIVREHWEAERKEMHVILDEYLLFCRQMGVRAQKLQIEMYSIEKGIVELISKHKIQKLVMGAAAEKHHKRNMMEISSNKAKYVRGEAPDYCHIHFICKGHLIFTREASRDTEIGDSNRWQSVTLGHNRGSTAPGQSHCLPARCVTLRNNSKSSGSGIFQMTPPEGTEELSSPKARLDAEGSSDEWERLSRSPAGSGCSTGSPMVDVTLTAWNDQGSDSGLELNALSPALVYSRSPFTMELPSSSQQPSPELISSDAVFDNTLYEQLQQAMAEAEKETRRRQKAERDKIETVRRAKEELVQRKEFEKSLAKEKEELEQVYKSQKNQLMEELQISREREISLNGQIGELKKERDELQMELDRALKEAEELREKLKQTPVRQMSQFSEFSLSEIEEATQSFDESLKIGQGGYGNIYKGLLHQTEVAIKTLQPNSSQGTSEFQMEVHVLSQLRHPNLVKLFGYCPEVFALIYEYLPNGSLEDRLRCRDNNPPLSWKTRIRIATELCSVLVYLHVAPFGEKNRHYFDFQRRSGQLPMQKEGEEVDYRGALHRDGSVLMSVSLDQLKMPELLYKSLAAKLVVGMPFKDLATVDSILLRELPPVDDDDARLALKRLVDISMGVITPLSEQLTKPLPNAMVLVNLKELLTGAYKLLPEGTRLVVSVRGDEPYEELEILKDIDPTILLHELPFTEDKISRIHAARRLFEYLADSSLNYPVIHHIMFLKGIHRDDLVIGAGSNAGALLVDGLGDGVLLEAPDKDFDFLRNTSFNLLQGCRMRNTKTEYVSCPSCGRTLFDLQEISAEIREKTSHLPGVSIAIMGCIVNGPGEMADADFGYVGGTPGKIDLYVGKTVVKRGIAMEHATDALIQLIKDHGRWVDPPAEE